jgi:cytochrome c-type biogenesis protein CcmH
VKALALAAVAFALGVALAGAGAATAAEAPPTPSDVEDEVLCPTCETTLDQSNSPVARRMKAFIRARIAAGDSKGEIKAKLVDDFGEQILASPPRKGFNLLAWWLPVAGLGAGALVVGALAWRWSRPREAEADGVGEPVPPAAPEVDPALERRLDEELARFEA